MYQVITLRSQENVLDSDVTIKTFKTFNKAKEFFNFEKESVKAEIFGISDEEDIEIRIDNENEFCIYDDDTGYAVKIKIVEVEDNSFVAVSF